MEWLNTIMKCIRAPFRQLGHNVVTNTAPTPAVRMRITSHSGQETRIVGLGEPLTLRIEIDSASTSAFGISARNVEARTDNGELLTLIDSTGYVESPPFFFSHWLFKFFHGFVTRFFFPIFFSQMSFHPFRIDEIFSHFLLTLNIELS